MTETGGRGGPCSSEHEPEVGYAHNPNPFCRNGEPGGGLADADLPVNHGVELFLSGMRFSKSVTHDRRRSLVVTADIKKEGGHLSPG